MSRRLEIELTSKREDGTWTWRAAGARQPKGEVAGDLLPESAEIGSVLKAEADASLDGLQILTVFAPRVRSAPDNVLELIGGGTSALVSRGGRAVSRDAYDEPDDARAKTRKGRDDRTRGRDGAGRRPRARSSEQDDRRDTKRARDDRRGRSRDETRDRDDQSEPKRRERHRGQGDKSRGPRQPGGARRDSAGGGRDDSGPRRGSSARQRMPKPRKPALKTKRTHRDAALKALPEEQQPLAREVLGGGVPGVRSSIERMNTRAKAEKLPQINAAPILALAETLAPMLKAAEWHDRADAVLAGMDRIDLRDIRSVIAAADRAARTDETRALTESLREGLARRVESDHRRWLDELAGTIHEGRTVRALRVSSHPPKAGVPLPPDMAERLAGMASADLTADTGQQRWATLVDAVAVSPVRTHVVPEGIPEQPGEELLATMRSLAERVPQIASMFGLSPQPVPPRRERSVPPPPPVAAMVAAESAAPTGEPSADDGSGGDAGEAPAAPATAIEEATE